MISLFDGTRDYIVSAAEVHSDISGHQKAGMKMRGPYAYEPPRYWLILDISCRKVTNQQLTVTLKNSSRHFAFFTGLSLISGDDNQLLIPIFWQDNYVSLASGEVRKISAKALDESVIGEKNYKLKAKAWNAQAETECL